MRILTVFGTRPEAIKLAPVVRALTACPEVDHLLCVTGQHRQMLDQVLDAFELRSDFDINLMKPGQDLTYVTSHVLSGVGSIIDKTSPDWVVIQGDTTTAFGTALAAFYRKVKVAHVEAGLRSGNDYSPWPEEMNRKLVSALTALHFPPTPLASQNLRAEGIPDRIIYMTGNTIVDALEWMNNRLLRDEVLSKRLEGAFSFLDPLRRIVLVTGHRRENFDSGLEQVCLALRRLADRGDIEIVYPVHLNPRVQELAKKILVGHPRVHLIEPLPYESFVALMRRAYIIVTDSGGIQEEAPSLGKPVLVTRQETERPEAIAAGAARLVGTNKDTIVSAVTELLNNQDAYENMAQARNPFGDGKAAERIAQRLLLER